MVLARYKLTIFGPLLYVAFSGSAPTAFSHHGPEEVIADLTTRIEAHGSDATIFVRRADEWRILGKTSKAIADYQSALQHDPQNRLAHIGLARASIRQGSFDAAVEVARRGLTLVNDVDAKAVYHALAATASSRRGDHQSAASDWEKALKCEKPEVDWVLQYARSLQRLGRQVDARDALAAAQRTNASIVLRRAWIDSLIRCKDFQAAEAQIETGLQRSRWGSSWLLQRAALSLAKGDHARAREDAEAVRREIARRTIPRVENPILEQQRQRALELLEEIDSVDAHHSAISNI